MEFEPKSQQFLLDDNDRHLLGLPKDVVTADVEQAAELLSIAETRRKIINDRDLSEFFHGSILSEQRIEQTRVSGLLTGLIKQFTDHLPSVADGAEEFLRKLD